MRLARAAKLCKMRWGAGLSRQAAGRRLYWPPLSTSQSARGTSTAAAIRPTLGPSPLPAAAACRCGGGGRAAGASPPLVVLITPCFFSLARSTSSRIVLGAGRGEARGTGELGPCSGPCKAPRRGRRRRGRRRRRCRRRATQRPGAAHLNWRCAAVITTRWRPLRCCWVGWAGPAAASRELWAAASMAIGWSACWAMSKACCKRAGERFERTVRQGGRSMGTTGAQLRNEPVLAVVHLTATVWRPVPPAQPGPLEVQRPTPHPSALVPATGAARRAPRPACRQPAASVWRRCREWR